MRVEHVVPVEIAADQVDLAAWFFSMSDADYRATTDQHLAFGTFALPDRKRGAVIVEDIGGMLIINRYHERRSARDFLEISSPRTQVWAFRLFHSEVSITATFRLRAVGSGRSELVLTVEGRAPGPVLGPIFESRMNRRITLRHMREEMAGFARDIVRKHAPVSAPTA